MSHIIRHQLFEPSEAPPADEPVSELFHENTKLRPIPAAQMMLVGNFTIPEYRSMARAYKLYRSHPQVALPDPASCDDGAMNFDAVIDGRRSLRAFADTELELPALGKILHQTYGMTGECLIPEDNTPPRPARAAPSAGALYPGEIYLGVRRVSGLEPGIYHYEVPTHALAQLRAGDPTDQLFEVCCWQEYARQAAVVVLIAAAMHRTKRKYGERGYRYVLLDLGHLAQNLYLSCTALGLAVTTTGGFFDDVANELLRLDGVDESVMYVAFLGPSDHQAGGAGS
jgi:SagB-type dehydrogenase family enzyme